MERWVLVRRSADVGWRREDMNYSRNRWVSQWYVSTAILVPGGRWLLVGCVDGSMTTYDLDAATLTGRQYHEVSSVNRTSYLSTLTLRNNLPILHLSWLCRRNSTFVSIQHLRMNVTDLHHQPLPTLTSGGSLSRVIAPRPI